MGRKSCVIIVEFGMPRWERCQSGDGGCMPWVRLRERLEFNLNIPHLGLWWKVRVLMRSDGLISCPSVQEICQLYHLVCCSSFK
jgi:hypothetical protein